MLSDVYKRQMFQENIAACAPLPSQYAAIEALRNSKKYAAGMIEEFTLRRNVLLEEVAKIKTITVDAPQGTFYAMLNIKSTGLKSEEFAYAPVSYTHLTQNFQILKRNKLGIHGKRCVRINPNTWIRQILRIAMIS